MKIVTYEEMVELPVGSVFCKYEPCVVDARWIIKTGETRTTFDGERNFVGAMYLEPWAINMDDMPSGKGTFETEMTTVDTCPYDIGEKGALFAVLEDYEVIGMIDALLWTLNKYKNDFK